MDVGLDRVLHWSGTPGNNTRGASTLHHIHSPATWQHNLPSCICVFPSVNGPTSGASCILVPLLRFVFQMMFFGLCWQLTCSTESLPSWWPCAFTATITFSSRLPHFPGRRVCQTARRKTPSTKINKLTVLSQSYIIVHLYNYGTVIFQNVPIKAYFIQRVYLQGINCA